MTTKELHQPQTDYSCPLQASFIVTNQDSLKYNIADVILVFTVLQVSK